ncbi:MAG: cysteine desulfurase NifS [Candidatus Andersenbacteria bacterium RIFCSPLOWO2_12_FULL_45_8]|nr:MAG: cysteine desulfurase NifS [Candidatus Andersenbacteria bacterium RIFCSPLOWO2_12_FULL_45_8]
MRVYLDHAATTPCDTEVIKAMEPYWQVKFGNPSSPHRLGGEAEEAIEQARAQVASLIGAESGEIIFTGSGTASDNLAIKGVAFKWQKRGRHIVTTQIEHPAVLESCRWLEKQNFKVTYLPVDEWGVVQVSDVAQVIREDTILVSIMHGNNEVGSIQPIEQISQLTSERGIYLHVDAVQTGGSIPINVKTLGADLLSLSAHKLYGPKGVGALYLKKGGTLDPWLHGGQQENRWRASTQNVPGIVGFGRAAELVCERIVEDSDRLLILRDKLRDGLLNRIPDIRINGHFTERLPSNVNVSVAGVEGEGMVLHLDAAGIMCSTGSACSAHNLQPSHVLMAMGIRHEIAHGSLRFTLGRSTTEEEIDYVLEVLPAIVEKLRVMSPLVQERVA